MKTAPRLTAVLVDKATAYMVSPHERYEQIAQRIADAWSDVLDRKTATEAARATVSPASATHGSGVEIASIRDICVAVLQQRRRYWGLGLADAMIEKLADIAQRVYDDAG